MTTFLIDSDTFSYFLGKDKKVSHKLRDVLNNNAEILICPVVLYEVRRGLYQKKMTRELCFFNKLISFHSWREFSIETWNKGAELWAECRMRGQPTGEGLDGDVLIAAQAYEHNATVVTHNHKHFDFLGVPWVDWLI
ncbi:MAG: PIN domain-containing protein [Planctomycetes bacterium]|nr:PIN domain-containing protein [Planctomycetota bacterium]